MVNGVVVWYLGHISAGKSRSEHSSVAGVRALQRLHWLNLHMASVCEGFLTGPGELV